MKLSWKISWPAERIFLYCDRTLIVCLCFIIFCLPFAKAGVESFAWFGIFIWLLKRILGYRDGGLWRLFPKTGLNKALGLLIVITALSVIFSGNFGLSLKAFFGKELKFLAIFFMIVESISSRERLKVILLTIIASALLITIDAGFQYFTRVDFLRGHEFVYCTFGASFYSANGFSAWLIVIIPLLIGVIAANIIPNLKFKILLFALIIGQFLCLLRTYSRGAWLGFAIGNIAMFYFLIKKYFSLKFKVIV